MAVSPISKLPKRQHRELLDDLYYLNTSEIKSFCKQHAIPYTISIETRDGTRRKTNDDDRKGVMLDRIRHFLRTGVILEETCFRTGVVCLDPLPDNLTANDKLYYGQYDKTSRAMITILKDLTGGQFRSGAIARILARKFWSRGKAPTFKEYAAAWLEAQREHTRPAPEAAYLTDRTNKTAGPDWKKKRTVKASKVLMILQQITAK